MHTIIKAITLTIVLVSVYGLETQKDTTRRFGLRTKNLLDVEPRRQKDHYFLHPYYGWHALTWIYWIKVKLVVVAFFAYTAFIWALRYMESNKCTHAGHQHVYYDHGHYRSFPAIGTLTSLQSFGRERKRRSLRVRKVS